MDAKSGYAFLSGDVTNQAQSFNVKGRARCKFRALYDAGSVANIPRGVLGTKVNHLNTDTGGRGNL